MFFQKICFCFLNIVVAFSAVKAQSSPKASLKYVGSFASQIHASRLAVVNTSEAFHSRAFFTPVKFKYTPKVKKPGSVAGALLGGVLGGVVGFAGGALIGLYADDCYKDGGEETAFCNVDTGLYAGSAGGAVLLAAGVHLGNGKHGRFEKDLLVSVLIGGVGLGTAIATESPTILLTVPIVQLIGTVVMERIETPAE